MICMTRSCPNWSQGSSQGQYGFAEGMIPCGTSLTSTFSIQSSAMTLSGVGAGFGALHSVEHQNSVSNHVLPILCEGCVLRHKAPKLKPVCVKIIQNPCPNTHRSHSHQVTKPQQSWFGANLAPLHGVNPELKTQGPNIG